MRVKRTKKIFLLLISIVSFFLIGTFIVSDFSRDYVSAVSGNGGAIYVGSSSKYSLSNNIAPISFNSATNGGGIYIENGGVATIRRGKIYGNTATSGFGHDIYNAGTLTMAGTIGTSVKCKRYDSEENESLTGEYVYFGSYPQTIKEESVTIDASDVDSNGYYLGSDGERYAMVSSPEPYDSEYTFSDGTAISSEETYYFKVEPLKWRILSDENGRALLFCEKIINAYHYYNNTKTRTIGGNIGPNNYKYSDIRSWLNGNAKERGNIAGENWEGNGFLQNAFSTEEQNFIFTTTVDNSAESTLKEDNILACPDTKDKVFLLSNSELVSADYGFVTNDSFDQAKRKSTTDFALVNGAYYDTTTGTKKVGQWWTRSPYWDVGRITITIDSDGKLNKDIKNIITVDQFGIVPAITISSSILEREGYGIYNTGTMNIYGGTIYDDIYSETSFNTRVSAYIFGTITLSDSATITVENYDGLELDYDIIISDTRENGTILILQGNETAPDLSGFNITGYDTKKQRIISSQNEDGDWEVKLAYKQGHVRLSKGTGIESVSGAGVYDYGTTVTVSATPSPGYHWKNWTYRNSSVVKSTSQNYTFTVGTSLVVLKANAEPNTYSIAFDKNLSYASGSMENLSMTYDVSTNLTENAFSAVGVTFKGWATSSTGEVSYEDCESVSNLTTTNGETITLYAVWEKSDITFTFDADGGTCSTTSKTVKYGRNVSNLPTPTKEGYVFDGWYAEFTGTASDAINFGREYMYTDKISIHLEAYSENWADVADQRLISCTEGGGWNIEGSSAGSEYVVFTAYDKGVGYKSIISSIKWEDLSVGWHTFDMIFDGTKLYGYLDGTEIARSSAFTSGQIGYNATNSIFIGAEPLDDPNVPYNLYFKGKIGNVVIQHSSERYISRNVTTWTVSAHDVTLHARWTPIYTITLDNQSATSSGTTTIYEKYGVGYYSNSSATTSITSINVPKRTGYGFRGYWTIGGTEIINSSGVIVGKCSEFTANTTIYARWVAEMYTITLDNQGATTVGTSKIFETYESRWGDGTTSGGITSITAPSKAGYTFGGYYTEKNGSGTQIIGASGTILAGNTMFTSSTTIYAKWTANTYTITVSGGTINNNKYSTSTSSQTRTLAVNSKTGYTFTGWTVSWTDSTGYGGTEPTAIKSTLTIPANTFGNVTITAQHSANTYTIKFDSNKPSIASSSVLGSTSDLAMTYNVAKNLTTNGFSLNGYTFQNWNTKTDGTGTTYSDGQSVSNLTATNGETITLYAVWKENVIKLTLNKNGGSGGTDYVYYRYGINKFFKDSSCTTEFPTNSSGLQIYDIPTKTGHTFIKYNGDGTSGGGEGERYLYGNEEGYTPGIFASDLCTDIYADATLTAVWSVNVYKITLNNQSATTAGTTEIYVKYGIAWYSDSGLTIAINKITIPEKTGYIFKGYFTSGGLRYVGEDGTLYSQSVNILENTTIYAEWVKAVSITFDANGGTSAETNKIFEYGTTINTLPSATRSGYTFDGWYAEFTGTASDAINFGREYMFTDKISIHFEAYSDNWADVEGRRMISCTETGGWNIEGNSGKINFCAYDSGVGYVNEVSDIYWSSLSAGWHTFDMIFDGKKLYGYVDGVNVATSSEFSSGKIGYNETNAIFVGAEAGTSASEPTTTNADYFIGKIGNVVIQHSSERYTSSSVTTWTIPNQDVTLHALWSSTFTFDANGGYCSTTSKTNKYGTTDSNLPTPTKSGYEFSGWYAEFDGVDDFINFGRMYMFTDKISIHLEAYSDNWANVVNQKLISCTETGGWNIEGSSAGSEYVVFTAYDKGVGYKSIISSIKWEDLTVGWHTFDMIFDGKKLYGYVDGVNVATSSEFSSGKIGYNETNSIFVGAEPSSEPNVPYNQYFKGKIGNVVIQHSSELFTSSNITTWTVPTYDVTLHARWVGNTYTIVFNKNDTDVLGSVTGTMSNLEMTYGISKNLTKNGYILTGYKFNGWAISVKGSKVYDDEQLISNLTIINGGTITLYAVWTVNTFTVTYEKNKPSSASGTVIGSVQSSKFTYGVATNKISSSIYMLSGWTFKGWSKDKNATDATYEPAKTLTVTQTHILSTGEDVVLYAVWSVNTYTIVFNKNNTNATGMMSNLSMTYDIAKNLPENTFVLSGYTFQGWNTKSDGSGKTYSDGLKIKNLTGVNNNTVNLYAIWKENVTYVEVEFYDSGSSTSYETRVLTEGSVIGELPTPTHSRYYFAGWFTSSSGGTQISESTIITSNITFYAHWSVYLRVDEDGNVDPDGDYILFGYYPQSASSSLSGLVQTNGDIATCNGDTYKIVNGIYYKYEPLKWRILKEENGEALLFCENIIDASIWSESATSAYTYFNSEVRNFITGEFYNKAFLTDEQNKINITIVDNSLNVFDSGINDYFDSNTKDEIFLLSFQDMINTSYGFSSSYNTKDDARKKSATAYAKAKGLSGDNYWLRTYPNKLALGNSNKFNADEVLSNGMIGSYNKTTICGVVPALWLNIGSGTSSFASSSGNEKATSESVFERVSNNDPLNLGSMMTLMSILSVKTVSDHNSGNVCKDLFFEEKRRRKYFKYVSKKK